jgi:hypothetical protein
MAATSLFDAAVTAPADAKAEVPMVVFFDDPPNLEVDLLSDGREADVSADEGCSTLVKCECSVGSHSARPTSAPCLA